jgi:hypothetical protein
VVKKLKFHLNQMEPDQFIVGIAIRNANQKDFNKKVYKKT